MSLKDIEFSGVNPLAERTPSRGLEIEVASPAQTRAGLVPTLTRLLGLRIIPAYVGCFALGVVWQLCFLFLWLCL